MQYVTNRDGLWMMAHVYVFRGFFMYVVCLRACSCVVLERGDGGEGEGSVFFVRFFIRSVGCSRFCLLTFFAGAGSISLLCDRVLSLLAFSLFYSSFFYRRGYTSRLVRDRSELLYQSVPYSIRWGLPTPTVRKLVGCGLPLDH